MGVLGLYSKIRQNLIIEFMASFIISCSYIESTNIVKTLVHFWFDTNSKVIAQRVKVTISVTIAKIQTCSLFKLESSTFECHNIQCTNNWTNREKETTISCTVWNHLLYHSVYWLNFFFYLQNQPFFFRSRSINLINYQEQIFFLWLS